MPFIPRPVKPPAPSRLTCQVPEATATMLKRYCEFMESTQGYVIVWILHVAFRRDKEFQAWLATTYPGTRVSEGDPLVAPADPPRHTHAIAAARTTAPPLPDPRGERARP